MTVTKKFSTFINKGGALSKILLFLTVVLFLVATWFSYFNLVYTPSEIIKSVNSNIFILNENLNDTEKTLSNTDSTYNSIKNVNFAETDKVKQNTNLLVNNAAEIGVVLKKAKDSLNQVDGGFNEDSVNFSKLTKSYISLRMDILQTLDEVIKYDICFISNYYDLIINNNSVAVSLSNAGKIELAEPNYPAISLENKNGIQTLENNTVVIDNLTKCFDQSNNKFYNSEAQALLQNDKKQIENTINSLKLLNTGLTNGDQNIINEANGLLSNNSLQLKFVESGVYEKSISKSNSLILEQYEALKKVEAGIDNSLTEIKKKYNIA